MQNYYEYFECISVKAYFNYAVNSPLIGGESVITFITDFWGERASRSNATIFKYTLKFTVSSNKLKILNSKWLVKLTEEGQRNLVYPLNFRFEFPVLAH